ncbi:UNKNOWN [Stylonychia lemnae]|uniref:Uncharacterized protein n=1 Tax=Stylonychia lemnae TaxID=5949 RepID=A0A078AWW5_STYLE|nr:UNKNOWN [Stylonychia lemnae]|eukprot:CDW86659.1 UNKNOWN [Stylonychia lemnae]
MANSGATLQNYNTELIKMLETIKENRDEVQVEIDAEESEKRQIEENMKMLSLRLQELNESLSKKYNTRNEFDKTISETENAFMKILESSQTLLHVLKKEGASLNKKKAQTLTGVKKGDFETPQRDH